MPGNRISIPNVASPVTFNGTSRFFCSVPIRVNRSGVLILIFDGSGSTSRAALAASLPYVVLRPVGVCVMTLFFATGSPTEAPHLLGGGRGRRSPRLGPRLRQVIAAFPHSPARADAHAAVHAILALELDRFAATGGIVLSVARDRQSPRRRLLPGVAIGRSVLRSNLAPIALELLRNHHPTPGEYSRSDFALCHSDH